MNCTPGLSTLTALEISTAANAKLDAVALANDATHGARMMAEVYEMLGRFISYPSDHARVAHSLWVAHTHLMDRWDSTPRLAFLSAEPASGKSRALEITEMLVPSPVCAVNVSPAYLFRKVGNDEGATILFDEIDTVFGPRAKENEEIRGLLNAGHRRGAVAGRCVVRGKEVMTEELPAYAAVALAGLGWLPDTILTRSIVVRMQRRKASEAVEQYRRRIHWPDGERVRSMIEVWAGAVPVEITWPDLPEQIQDRDADVWEPLVAVADMVGGDWPDKARKAAVTLVTASKEGEVSLGVRLLADIKTVFEDRFLDGEAPTGELLKALHALDESPWSDMKGKPLDDNGLARRLRQYGIKSSRHWFGSKQARCYERGSFLDAWSRYLPQPRKGVTPVTLGTESEKPNGFRPYCVTDAVTAQRDVTGSGVTGDSGVTVKTPDFAEFVTPVTGVTGLQGNGKACAHCGRTGTLQQTSFGGETVLLHSTCIETFLDAHRGDAADDYAIPADGSIPRCLRRDQSGAKR